MYDDVGNMVSETKMPYFKVFKISFLSGRNKRFLSSDM